MNTAIYTQGDIVQSKELTDFLLDTIIDNLQYLFGEEMGTEENRREWVQYNLKIKHPHWRAILGRCCDENAGFLLYTVEEQCLVIHDIEIRKENRFNPFLMIALFKTLFRTEKDSFDTICGYINKENRVSQRNFLKFATQITEKGNGYWLETGKTDTSKIKEKFQKST